VELLIQYGITYIIEKKGAFQKSIVKVDVISLTMWENAKGSI